MTKPANSVHAIDLNCDLGESYGLYTIGNDEGVIPLVSSANIACGFHAGDPSVMRRTVQLCVQYDVQIGAHPGYSDLQGFGRRELKLLPQEIYELMLYQLGALYAFTKAEGAYLRHVKPHGALYNRAAQDPAVADAIAKAVRDFDPSLMLYGLSGSQLITAAQHYGLAAVSEVFADRTYQSDGSLTPRSLPGSVHTEESAAICQVLQMIREGTVTPTAGGTVPIEAQTVCIHGDSPHAVVLASSIRKALLDNGIRVAAPSRKDSL